jgi:hypothetical protein
MTFQIIMCAQCGMVVASDRTEISNEKPAQVTKIRVDKTGKFAWVYSGPRMVSTFSRHLVRAFDSENVTSDNAAIRLISRVAPEALEESRQYEMPGGGDAVVALACGASRNIFRAVWRPVTEPEPIHDKMCCFGQSASPAAFVARHFYSEEMGLSEMVLLAAYSVALAHEFDKRMVEGLDIAAYRDSVGRFEFVDSEFYQNEAKGLDQSLVQLLKKQAPIVADHLLK